VRGACTLVGNRRSTRSPEGDVLVNNFVWRAFEASYGFWKLLECPREEGVSDLVPGLCFSVAVDMTSNFSARIIVTIVVFGIKYLLVLFPQI